MIINDRLMDLNEKKKRLLDLRQRYAFLERELLEFLFAHYIDLAWSEAGNVDPFEHLDLFWHIPKERLDLNVIRSNAKLSQIYSAKKMVDYADGSELFELDLLIKLPQKDLADLEFEYVCGDCLSSYPIYFGRCPTCFASKSAKISANIIKKARSSDENSASFY